MKNSSTARPSHPSRPQHPARTSDPARTPHPTRTSHSTRTSHPDPASPIINIIITVVILLAAGSCSPLSGYRELIDADFQQPLLLNVETLNESAFMLQFSEPVNAAADAIQYLVESTGDTGTLKQINMSGEDTNALILQAGTPLRPGERCLIRGYVTDRAGNSLTFSAAAYGWNDQIPNLVINEFTTQGSSANPDRVELAVTAAGNTAGVTFYDGVSSDWIQRVILPPIDVEPGDFIVIHCGKEPVYPEPETLSISESDSPHAIDTAWDIWIPEGSGLSGNNGIISLYASPRGELLDAVLYSNRTSTSDTNYAGFGSKALLARTAALAEEAGWLPHESVEEYAVSDFEPAFEPASTSTSTSTSTSAHGTASSPVPAASAPTEPYQLKPEDGVNPDPSTATRSMCRWNPAIDTDTRHDWYIVPVRKASFGEINYPEEYNPD